MIPHGESQWQMWDITLATGIIFGLFSIPYRFVHSAKIFRPGLMTSITPIKLNIPAQDLQAFNLFALNAEAARTWAQGLPVTNTRSVVQQLRKAVNDLNHMRLAPEVRYDIMEVLRPNLDVALSNLSKRFLNQPLVMPEQPRQMAELADGLYGMASTAYSIVAIETIQQRDSIRGTNPARLTCEAVQRALVFGGRKILQAMQLNRPAEANGWLALHQLYALADAQQLANLPVAEPLSGGGTVTATYLQALMLGCCKPNQLRQSDLAALYRGLQEWGALVRLEPPPKGEGLFLVDLDSDQPPLYSSLYEGKPGVQFRYLNTDALIKCLEMLKTEAGSEDIYLDQDTSLPSNVLDHLIASLGSMSLRNFNRAASGNPLWVCVGLSSTHYHVAGERVFEQLLHGDSYVAPASARVSGNPFLHNPEKSDLWQQANPEQDYDPDEKVQQLEAESDLEHQVELDETARAELLSEEDSQLPPDQRYPVFQVQLADTSPGGYCIEWTAELPGDIRAGDIVSLKERQDTEWVIAVIRWVSQLRNARTLIGLELLSPRALPYGARIPRKTGDQTAPMRVLLLPEIKLVGQPHTLITPRTGFRERQKITLLSGGEEHHVQLLRQVNATGSFAQFDFRYIKQLGDVLAEDKSGHLGSSYDSVWSRI